MLGREEALLQELLLPSPTPPPPPPAPLPLLLALLLLCTAVRLPLAVKQDVGLLELFMLPELLKLRLLLWLELRE